MEKKYDLVVVGGGLAGVCGAIAGKRMGLSVCIIQDRPVLGGNASSEIRVPIGGAGDHHNPWARETGIICELFLEERKNNFQYHNSSLTNSVLDLVLYDALRREGVDIFLNTVCRKAIMKKNDLIEGVYCIQLASEKEFIIKGDFFFDASGDGIVGFTAGAEYRIGREGKDEFGEELAPEKPDMGIMGNSLMFLVRDVGKPVKFEPPSWAVKYPKDDITLKLRGHSYMPGYWWIEIGYPFDTIHENEEIKHNLLAHLLGVWDHLKNAEDHGFSNFTLEWVGMVPGKRESRRFVGDYILKEKDVKERRFFEDAVAYGGWFIDLHTPGGILAKNEYPEPTHSGDIDEIEKTFVYIYSIPYRCLYSKNIKNLLFAGRNISVTHVALGTTRLMGTCAILGQAAGTSIYLCKKYNCYPRDIYEKGYYKELQQILLKEGCFIPGIKNEDENDKVRNADIKGSSSANLVFERYTGERELKNWIGQKLALSGYIEKIILKVRSERETILKFHLRSSFDLWDFSSSEDIVYKEIKVKKGEQDLEIPIGKNFEKGIYWFYFDKEEGVFLKETDERFPGFVEIFKVKSLWRFVLRKNLYFKVEPVFSPFEPENIKTGVSRPEKWTNVWISNPKGKFPQYLEIDFKKEEEFNSIQFIFDAEIDKGYPHLPPFYVPCNIPRDFKVYIWKNGKWNEILNVEGNTRYFCRYSFDKVKSDRVRIEFLKTNGGSCIYVYEVRIY